MKIRTAMICGLMSLVLSPLGCKKKPGSEYVGKWLSDEKAPETLEIIDNGENYLLKITPPAGSKIAAPAPVAATVHDGLLQAGALSFTYIESTKTVTMTVPGFFGNSVFTLKKIR